MKDALVVSESGSKEGPASAGAFDYPEGLKPSAVWLSVHGAIVRL